MPRENRERVQRLQDRAFRFMCDVIRAYPGGGSGDMPAQELWRQLVRASMSSAGNLEEADAASSRADFIAKMRIVLRESREAVLWLRAIVETERAGYQKAAQILPEGRELKAIYTAIVKNANQNSENSRLHKFKNSGNNS